MNSGKPVVLVTGGRGFIGRWTIPELLARGFEVHIASRTSTGEPLPDGVQAHCVDLWNEAETQVFIGKLQPTHMLHLAWNVTPGAYWTSLDNFRWVSASLHLAQVFWRSGGRRGVFAGTCAEYDWSRSEVCQEDETPTVLSRKGVPAPPYAACKAALERMLSSFSTQEKASFAWGRVFFQYGPFENSARFIPSVILNILQGFEAPCTHGHQRRSFLHVADVAKAFVDILESDVTGSINIGGNEEISLAEVATKIATMLGHPELLRLGARAAPPDEPSVLLPDVNRLWNQVGFRPQYSFDKGIRNTIDWWRRRLDEGKAV